MFAEVDVFISNYTLVDPEVYQLWVDGCSSSEAVSALHVHGVTQHTGATLELVASDVLDHYRTYSLLERLLHNPPKLAEQLAFQIEPQTRQLLIEKYYEFNDEVIRELLGKKLSSRHRKDLDEVSEKTGISLKSCRRQFDNVKRVFKTVEEMQGSVVQNITNLFFLPEELAKDLLVCILLCSKADLLTAQCNLELRRYGAVVFLACMRFETSKRKLQHLSFSDFYNCALNIMVNWTYAENTPDFDDTDLDREFLLDLRELRSLMEKEKEHKHLVCMRLKPTLLEKTFQELEGNFRTFSRALIGLACNLHRSRDLRCLFLELVEKCLEPWKQVSWSHSDLRNFLTAYSQCAMELDVLREAELKATWERFVGVVANCLLRLYHQ